MSQTNNEYRITPARTERYVRAGISNIEVVTRLEQMEEEVTDVNP
jgi:hypothetical protein